MLMGKKKEAEYLRTLADMAGASIKGNGRGKYGIKAGGMAYEGLGADTAEAFLKGFAAGLHAGRREPAIIVAEEDDESYGFDAKKFPDMEAAEAHIRERFMARIGDDADLLYKIEEAGDWNGKVFEKEAEAGFSGDCAYIHWADGTGCRWEALEL